MGRIQTYISILVLIILGVGIYLMNVYNSIIFAIVSLVVAVGYLVWTFYRLVRTIRIVRSTENMEKVERFVMRRKDRPYNAALLATLHGDYDAARRFAKEIPNPNVRRALDLIILAKQGRYEEVLELLPLVRNKAYVHEMRAKIALMSKDWVTYEEHMQHVKREVTRLALEADAAFVRGNMEEAERLGGEAISRARGMYRYVLVKERELNERDPARRTYF